MLYASDTLDIYRRACAVSRLSGVQLLSSAFGVLSRMEMASGPLDVTDDVTRTVVMVNTNYFRHHALLPIPAVLRLDFEKTTRVKAF
jgi:hypothetical protein